MQMAKSSRYEQASSIPIAQHGWRRCESNHFRPCCLAEVSALRSDLPQSSVYELFPTSFDMCSIHLEGSGRVIWDCLPNFNSVGSAELP